MTETATENTQNTENTAADALAPAETATDATITTDAGETEQPKGLYFDPENVETHKDIYKALGVPEAVDGYAFEFGEGVRVDDVKMAAFKDLALKNNITAEQAKALAQFDIEQQEAVAHRQLDTLKEKWGSAYEKNINTARQVFSKAGLEYEDVDRAAAAIGHDKILAMLALVGAGQSEGSIPTETISTPSVQSEFDAWYTPEIAHKIRMGDKGVRAKWSDYITRGATIKL